MIFGSTDANSEIKQTKGIGLRTLTIRSYSNIISGPSATQVSCNSKTQEANQNLSKKQLYSGNITMNDKEKKIKTSMEFSRQSFADPNTNLGARVQFLTINDY